MVREVSCPRCQARCLFAPNNAYRPFCSARCKNTDWVDWASEHYRVPTPPTLGEQENSSEVQGPTASP